MKYTKLFLLGLCSSFVFASCSDDVEEPSKDTTEDTVVTDLEWTNDALIEYVMSQFAELDENGNLVERTTYFRQIDESDTTAIFTCAPTLAEARQKFLTLVPPSLQQKIVVANDSAEMSLPIGTTPLALKYKEGSTDGNVVATVQLPSQGAYTKIANTLTMVKSFGENASKYWKDYIFRMRERQLNVLLSVCPVPLNTWFEETPGIYVKTISVNMFCYNVNEDGVAQYMYLPPFVEKGQLRSSQQLSYINGTFFSRLLNVKDYWDLKNSTLNSRQKELEKVLPSRKEMRAFIETISNFTGNDPETKENLLYYVNNTWTNGFTFSSEDDPLSEDTIAVYRDRADEFRNGFTKKQNVVDALARFSEYFPYFTKDYYKPEDIPLFVQRADAINWAAPFFRPGGIITGSTDMNIRLASYKKALSFATCEIYGRDKKNAAHVIDYYTDEYGDWEILDLMQENHFYQVFFEPAITSSGFSFVEKGRDITSMINNPLRIVYLKDVKIIK